MYAKVENPDWELINIDKYYRVWCEIMPSYDNKSKLYRLMTKILKILTSHRRDVDITNKYVTQLK